MSGALVDHDVSLDRIGQLSDDPSQILLCVWQVDATIRTKARATVGGQIVVDDLVEQEIY